MRNYLFGTVTIAAADVFVVVVVIVGAYFLIIWVCVTVDEQLNRQLLSFSIFVGISTSQQRVQWKTYGAPHYDTRRLPVNQCEISLLRLPKWIVVLYIVFAADFFFFSRSFSLLYLDAWFSTLRVGKRLAWYSPVYSICFICFLVLFSRLTRGPQNDLMDFFLFVINHFFFVDYK